MTIDTDRLRALLPCEDPEEPCDQDGRDEHRWCDACIARMTVAGNRALLDAAELGLAWQRAEAALEPGEEIYDLTHYGYDSDCGEQWRRDGWAASAGRWAKSEYDEWWFTGGGYATGPTPAAALNALADALEERSAG